jgi:membrane fusion protein (multidrug efflux system)
MPEEQGDARAAGGGDSARAESKGNDGEGGGEPDRPRSKKPLIILGIIVAVAAVAALFVWFARRNLVTTDDAYTDGNVVVMAPKVSGYVVALLVNDNTRVR